jgi:bifunctional non-homologous end joining protein LigD
MAHSRPSGRRRADAPARDGSAATRSLERLVAATAAPPAAWPLRITPMLATTAPGPFTRPGWLFELKFDGVRVLITRSRRLGLQLIGRRGRDMTALFPEIADAAAAIAAPDLVLDGELVAADPRGTGSFERLQQRLGLTNPRDIARSVGAIAVQVHAFDLLYAAGRDLRPVPLRTRKAILHHVLPSTGAIRFADHIEEHGELLFATAREHGGEGIVAKRTDSPYVCGRRSLDWLKIKVPRRASLMIVGYLPGRGGREPMGSLMLAWDRGDGLEYAGNVGSGLGPARIAALLPALQAAAREAPAFHPRGSLPRGVFVDPIFTADVQYSEITARGVLRQPILLAVHRATDAGARRATPPSRTTG